MTIKTKRIQKMAIDLGETGNTRIVIDRSTKDVKRGDVAQQMNKRESIRNRNDHLEPALRHTFTHGKNHMVNLPMDSKTYQQLKRLAGLHDRTITAEVRSIVRRNIQVAS